MAGLYLYRPVMVALGNAFGHANGLIPQIIRRTRAVHVQTARSLWWVGETSIDSCASARMPSCVFCAVDSSGRCPP